VAHLAENTASKIIGVASPSSGFNLNRIEIRTQFAGSGNTILKAPRIITGDFVLEEA
jgi:hypothetical protein